MPEGEDLPCHGISLLSKERFERFVLGVKLELSFFDNFESSFDDTLFDFETMLHRVRLYVVIIRSRKDG